MKEQKNLTDVQNPVYLFQTIGSDILCAIVNSEVDAVQLAREELAARGLNHFGQWVGFDEAEKIAVTSNKPKHHESLFATDKEVYESVGGKENFDKASDAIRLVGKKAKGGVK